MDLSPSQNVFDLGTYFSKRRVLRASKRDLEQEISATESCTSRFRSTKQAAEAFFLAYRLIKSGRPRVIHSIITVIHFSRAIKLYKRFYEIILRNFEFRKFWSVDYSFWFYILLLRMVSERVARIKVAFTTLSTAVFTISNREVFRRSRKITVNTVTLNALYNVNILWPKTVFPES